MSEIASGGAEGSMEVVSTQKTHVRAASTKLQWRIEQFGKLMKLFKNGQNLISKEFGSPLVPAVKWELHVYPNGKRQEDSSSVSFFLRQIGLKGEEEPIMTDFKIYAKDATGAMVNVCKDVKDFTHQQGRGKFQIQREKMMQACLQDGSLNLFCEVEFFPPGTKLTAEAGEVRTSDREVLNLKELLDGELFTDSCIKVGNKILKTHRCILGLYSQVFRSMFSQEGMLEAQNGLIDITDSYYEPVRAMLEFMYTGASPEIDKYPEEVLALAEKYAILKLKEVCEQKIARTLSLTNICTVVGFADTYNALQLKSACIHFLAQHHNQVLKGKDWARLKKEQPVLANELLEMVLSGEAANCGTLTTFQGLDSEVKEEPGTASRPPPRKRARRGTKS